MSNGRSKIRKFDIQTQMPTSIPFLEIFPSELYFKLATFIDQTSLRASASVSQSWNTLFNNHEIWKRKLADVYGFDINVLHQIKRDACFFRDMFKRRSRLEYFKNHKKLYRHTRKTLDGLSMNDLILAACTDDFDYAEANIAPEYYYLLFEVALLAGCENLPTAIANKIDLIPYQNKIGLLFDSRNLTVAKQLYSAPFHFNIDKNHLDEAIEHDWSEFANYLLQTFPEITPDNITLYLAIRHNHCILLDNLLARGIIPTLQDLDAITDDLDPSLIERLIKEYNLEPDMTLAENAAYLGRALLFFTLFDNNFLNKEFITADFWIKAAHARNINMLKVLHRLRPDISPPYEALEIATGQGNYDCVEYLLEFCRPNKSILSFAFHSGNMDIILLLFPNFIDEIDAVDIEEYAEMAANSGYLDAIKLLIEPHTQLSIESPILSTLLRFKEAALPTNAMLYNASFSKYDDIIDYLLKPEFKLSLTIDIIINRAVRGNTSYIQELLKPTNIIPLLKTTDLDDLYMNEYEFTHSYSPLNLVLKKHLLPSFFAGGKAIKILQAGLYEDDDEIYILLENALNLHPTYFFELFTYVINNQELCGLANEMYKKLLQQLDLVLTNNHDDFSKYKYTKHAENLATMVDLIEQMQRTASVQYR